MSEAPERIWAITEPNDISADILGEVYAQQIPDGMGGTPVEYIRADRIEELEAKLAEQIEWVKSLADDLIAAEGREARLKEKLAKAVDALQKMDVGEGWAAQIARTTLAELTGGKDD